MGFVACQPKPKTVTDVRWPFSADSAYSYIAQQVAFGARVPNTEEHEECGDWLVNELQRHGAEVFEQRGTMPNYATLAQPLRNIIAHIPGSVPTTILLCAHWDTRPWSDEEVDYDYVLNKLLEQKQIIIDSNDTLNALNEIEAELKSEIE